MIRLSYASSSTHAHNALFLSKHIYVAPEAIPQLNMPKRREGYSYSKNDLISVWILVEWLSFSLYWLSTISRRGRVHLDADDSPSVK